MSLLQTDHLDTAFLENSKWCFRSCFSTFLLTLLLPQSAALCLVLASRSSIPSDSSCSSALAILVILGDSPADLQAALCAVYACCPFTFCIGPKHVGCHRSPSSGWCASSDGVAAQVSLHRSHTMSQLASSRRQSLCLWRPSGPFDQRMVSWCRFICHFCFSCSLRMSCTGRLPVWSTSATTPQPCSSSTCHSDIFGCQPLGWPGAVHWELWHWRCTAPRPRARIFHCSTASAKGAEQSQITRARPHFFWPCSNEQGTWVQWCTSALRSLSVQHSVDFGISVGSRPSAVTRGSLSKSALVRGHDLHFRPMAMAYDSHGVCLDLATSQISCSQHNSVYSRSLSFVWSPSWCLVRWATILLQLVGLPVIRTDLWRALCASTHRVQRKFSHTTFGIP